MAKTVLVAGLVPYESGKTWFTLSSALYAKSLGLKVGIFKPVAGHSLWYSPRTIRKSIKLKLLVGNDITLYYEYGLVEDPAVANPLAIATVPPDPCFYRQSVEDYLLELENTYSTIVLSRVTNCRNRVVKHYYYPDNSGKTTPLMKKSVERLALALQAEKSSVKELIKYMESASSEENLDDCLANIQRGNDLLFVESFNDAVVPYVSLLGKVDIIVVVAPGKVLVYRDVRSVRELVINQIKKHGWEGFRAKHIISEITAQMALDTGFATRPKPRGVHKAFIESILEK